jgi:transcriptional regulator with XRE-family HTH domain
MGSVHSRDYQDFLVRLRKARTEAGLTQKEAARLLRKPQSFVSKSELGERRVDFLELQEFCRIYRRPLAFFQKGHHVQ